MTFDLPRSPLSDDPETWDRLARRINADAAAPLAELADAGRRTVPAWRGTWLGSWLGPLSRSAPWLVAASAAAMLAFWMALPPRTEDPGLGWIESSVAPQDVAGTLLGGALPPSVDEMMLVFPPPAGDRP